MKDTTNEKFKNIEQSLMNHDKSFGLLCIMGYYDAETDSDVDEYLLCTAVITKDNQYGVAVGDDIWILKDKEVKVSAEDLVSVFDMFRKCKKELICDLYDDVSTFNIDKYTTRIKHLQP